MEPSWEMGKKPFINGTGHMTKMAAMPIYGENQEQIESPVLLNGKSVTKV